jgi:hypothetical protein
MHFKWLVLVVVLLALSVDGLVLWPNFSRRVAVDASEAQDSSCLATPPSCLPGSARP